MSFPFCFSVVFLLVAMLFPLPCSADNDTVVVAAFYNATGGMSSIDGPALKGALLAEKRLNRQGGLPGGKKLKIVVYDTETDTAKASRNAVDAASRKDIVAGIGYGDTTFVLAAAPAFQKQGIPFVTSGATHPNLPGKVGDMLFLAAFGDDDQAAAIAEYAFGQLKVRKIAVWTDRSMDFTIALSGYFTKKFREQGGIIVHEDTFTGTDRDFSLQIERLKNVSPFPDAIFISAVPDEAGRSVREIREAGIKIPILSGDGFDTELLLTIPGPSTANVFFATHAYRGDTRPEVVSFIREYRTEYGKDPENAFAALGYDTVNLVADAARRAGSTDRNAIALALSGTRNFQGVTGNISYSRGVSVPHKPVAIVEVKNGSFRIVQTQKP